MLNEFHVSTARVLPVWYWYRTVPVVRQHAVWHVRYGTSTGTTSTGSMVPVPEPVPVLGPYYRSTSTMVSTVVVHVLVPPKGTLGHNAVITACIFR